MTNPCTRDCPDRFPGCNCERRQAWKFQQANLKEARRKARLADWFLGSCIAKTKENMRKGWKRR